MDRRAEVLQTAMDIVEVFFRDGADDDSTAVANFVEHLREQMGNYNRVSQAGERCV